METLGMIRNIDDLKKYAEIMYNSGLFPDIKNIDQACVKIMAGQEMGIPPVASMRGVYGVRGQISTSSQIMAALIKKSDRYDYKVIEATKEQCRIEFFEDGKSCGESMYSVEDAKTAKLMSNDVWLRHPKMMLFNRAMSNGAKMYCSEVFHGSIYVDGEIEDVTTGDESRDIPDMTGSQSKSEVYDSPPSRGHLGVLFGHLKRLGVRDGHKRQLVEFYSKGELTTHTVNEYNRELEFAVILPWAWFSSYVNMLMIDHPKYDRNTLRDYWKQNFGSAKADDLSIEQREGLINWIFMVEPDDIPEPDTESVPMVVAEPVTEDATESVDEPDADDTYTPDTTLAPSPWLPELQRIQNETQESLEQIEAWLLHKFGKKGTHHKVEDLPVALIDGVTKMSGDQIKESMNTVTML